MSCLPGVSFVAAMMFSATNKGVFYNFSIFQVIRSLVQEETSSAATSQTKSEAVEVEGEAHGQKFGTVWLLTMRTTDQFCEFKMAEMLRMNTIIIQMRCAC